MQLAAGALAGLRVIDLTTVIMGPFATATLADLGADVVKVESIDGDMNRSMGNGRHEGMSALSLNLHKNKRSIALDLSTDAGRQVLDDLVRNADVLVTNLRPRSRAKLGVTYERLTKVNPSLIVCTAQAYGSDSELRDYPAYDDIVQAASGAAMIAELVDGAPRYSPHVIADKVVGLYIVIAILAATLERKATGKGQEVDVPMVDTMIAFNLVEHFGQHTFSPPNGPFGWSRVLTPERVPHQTSDGWICIMPYSSKNWNDFFELTGQSELSRDPRFSTINDRHRHMGDLMSVIRDVAGQHTTAEWIELCRSRNIPASDLLDLAKATTDPYILDQKLIVTRTHPTEGEYHATRTPFNMARTPVAFSRHAPHLGEHTNELLTEIGYAPETIEALLESGVIARTDLKVDAL